MHHSVFIQLETVTDLCRAYVPQPSPYTNVSSPLLSHPSAAPTLESDYWIFQRMYTKLGNHFLSLKEDRFLLAGACVNSEIQNSELAFGW